MVNNLEEEGVSVSKEEYMQKSEDVFGENKVWIELKIRKEEEDEMKNYSINDDGERVCNFCNKAFSSGKALGGHMRIHVQKSSAHMLKVHHSINFKKFQNTSETEIDHFLEKKKKKTLMKQSCTICGKDFPSMKSLSGHMRTHPDRVWRGINPPPSLAPKNSSSSRGHIYDNDDDDDDKIGDLDEKNSVVDLSHSLKTWTVTARRGRRATTVSTSENSISGDDPQLNEAVNFLMILSRGKNFETNDNTVVLNQKLINKSDGQEWLDHDHNHASPPPIHHNQVFTSPDKYKCNACDKSFPTGQALGGHMSSHNKLKILIQNTIDQGCSHTGRRMLAFDLNEAPPESMEEIGFQSDHSLGKN